MIGSKNDNNNANKSDNDIQLHINMMMRTWEILYSEPSRVEMNKSRATASGEEYTAPSSLVSHNFILVAYITKTHKAMEWAGWEENWESDNGRRQ